MTSVEGRVYDTAFSGRRLSKTFPGQLALDDVDLDVGVGEIHALVGQNGSGKSTLVKILAGYHRPDPGASATLGGRPFELGSADAARAGGIRFVHQDLGLVESLSVTDNFHLADVRTRALTKIGRRHERATVTTALRRLGYHIDPDVPVALLAESERTAVAVARALDDLDDDPVLLVLDEPTASLPGGEVTRLFAALRRIAATGVGILFISHHLDEVLGLADRVTVLRDGRRITTAATGDVTPDQLTELLLGRQLLADIGEHHARSTGADSPVLTVRGLAGATIVDLDLDLGHHEVVGVAGLTGSGREELAGLVAGRLPHGGEVRVNGRAIAANQPGTAMRHGMCLVPADRTAHALLPATSTTENITIADMSSFWRRGRLRRTIERDEAQRWLEELDIRPRRGDTDVDVLSGGNQQKVVMARVLRLEPSVLVLDEPTQGVDVGSKADIHRLVDGAAAGGAGVIVCSTDSDELARLADRVIVLQRGRVVAELTGTDITIERIEEAQLTSVGRPDTEFR